MRWLSSKLSFVMLYRAGGAGFLLIIFILLSFSAIASSGVLPNEIVIPDTTAPPHKTKTMICPSGTFFTQIAERERASGDWWGHIFAGPGYGTQSECASFGTFSWDSSVVLPNEIVIPDTTAPPHKTKTMICPSGTFFTQIAERERASGDWWGHIFAGPGYGTQSECRTLAGGTTWDSSVFIPNEIVIPDITAPPHKTKTMTCPSGTFFTQLAERQRDSGDWWGHVFRGPTYGTQSECRKPAVGTVNINATLNGAPWSGSFVIDATHNGTLYPNVAITAPNVNSGVPTGAYILAYKSGGPAGATFSGITPSVTQTLTAGGTITFIFNFVTAPPSTGTININATLNGAPWSGPLIIDATHNGILYSNVAITAPNVNSGVPTGSYTLAYKLGGPAGATLSGITPFATQTLSANGTITFTFNFITTAPPPPTLIVSPSSASVNVGGAQQFNAVYDPDGSGPQFPLAVTNSSLWSSSNNAVATVSSVGVATGASAGFATITASYSGLTASAAFTVTAPVPSLTVTPSSASVPIGGTQQFTATYDPDGFGPNPSQNVTATAAWSSSDVAKVTVSGGLATRVGHGVVLVSASYLGLSDSATVLDPATLRVEPASADLDSGETLQLHAWYDADGAGGPQAEQDVTALSDWSSNKPATAVVNNAASKGLVTAQPVTADTKVRISAAYLGVSGSSEITVHPGVSSPPSVSLTANPSSVNPGGSTTLTWSVTAAASCTASGGWSGAKSPSGGSESVGPITGTTTFTLTCSNANGSSSASITVTVSAASPPQAPSNLQITPSSLNTCGAIGLTWQDNSNNEDRFELERDAGAGFLKISDVAANTTSFTDTTIAQNTSYSYRIRACNANGCSAYSNTAIGRNQSPSANFVWAPAQPKTNQNIIFSDTSVFFGGAGLRSRAWQFPGGTPATATSSPAQTKFGTIGTKTVRLDITDTSSRICSVAKNVAVASGITPPDWEEIPPE